LYVVGIWLSCAIPGFRREVDNCAVLDYHASRFITDVSGQPIGPIFRDQEQKRHLKMGPMVVPKRRQEITTSCCVITQKNAELLLSYLQFTHLCIQAVL
jgi:hypothetical protein